MPAGPARPVVQASATRAVSVSRAGAGQPPPRREMKGNVPRLAQQPELPLANPPDTAGSIRVRTPTLSERLQIPSTLPGARAPNIRLPPPEADGLRYEVIDTLFPDLPPMWPLILPRPTAEQPAVTLNRLQQWATEYNPTLIQARYNVKTALGVSIQAGTHPNPIVGYESDTVGSFQTRNYQGMYFSQLVKTANKLGLARAAANVDIMNAQLSLLRTRMEVLARVRRDYFAVLVAHENVLVNDALVQFMNEVLKIQVARLKGEEAAGFEPAQLRGLANAQRAQLVAAQNSYVAAWKTLAADMGLPRMPPMPLAGRADMPVPVVAYEAALARTMSVHPDILIGRNMVTRARLVLKLQEVTPIPDLVLYFTAQKDFTNPGVRSTSYNTQIGVPLPIWDRNRGNIVSAQGELGQASQQMRRAQMDLTAQLASTFNLYETNRIQLDLYANHILPDYARAYRGVYERYDEQPKDFDFEGIIVAQLTLSQAVMAYIASLTGQWNAVADLSYLMQVETLEEMAAIGGGRRNPAPEPVPPPPLPGRPRSARALQPPRAGGGR